MRCRTGSLTPWEPVIAPRNCNCGAGGGSTCQCLISAGEGILISGSGQPADPYVVAAEVTSFAAAFQARDTPTVDMTLVGSGTTADPFILSAASAIGMQQLTDVDDPSGPALGEVPVWNGLAFEFAAPPSTPPGAVNVGAGLLGDGAFATPLKVAVSDTTTTTTTGQAIYIDSAGQLRARPAPTPTITWNDVQSKPTTFPPQIGTTATTAKAGNWVPSWSEVVGRPTTSTIDGRMIYVSDNAPSNAQGVDGDLWFEY